MARTDSGQAQLVQAAFRGRRVGEKGYARVDCPFCEEEVGTPDTRQSLALYADSGYYWCFRCPTSGWLNGRPQQQRTQGDVVRTRPEQLPEAEPMWDREVLAARSYAPQRHFLARRNVPPSDWKRYRLHACALGYYARMCVIPRYGEDRKWDGFTARSWYGKVYKYPQGMMRDRFYLDGRIAQEISSPILIVEGAFDALPYRTTIACLGKPNHQLLLRLVKSRRPVVFCLDGDAYHDAVLAAFKLASMRYDDDNPSPSTALCLPPGSDPCDVARTDPRAMPFAAEVLLRATESVAYPPTWRAADFTVDAVRRWGEEILPKNNLAWLAEAHAKLLEVA